jgi:hypothetical protein
MGEYGRPTGRASLFIPRFDTRELLVTHQQPGQSRVLDYRFGWPLLDDLFMQRHIRVGIRGNAAMNYIQRRSFVGSAIADHRSTCGGSVRNSGPYESPQG